MINQHLMNKLSIIICAKNYAPISQALTSLEYELIRANDIDDLIRYCVDSSSNIVIVDAIKDCIALREHSQSVLILVLTDDVDAALKAGADDCLLFHPTLLQKRIQSLINTSQFNGYDAVPSMIHSIDKAGKILDVNTSWLTTMGYSKDEVLGKNITDFMSETSRQVAPRMIEAFWKTGVIRNIAFRYVKKSGDMIEALVDSNLVNSEQNLSVLRDITEIKRVENTLRDAQNELESVLNAIPDTITVINRDGKYVRVVSTGSQANSSHLDNLVGMSLHDILPSNDADKLLNIIQITLDTRTIQHHEYDINHDGATYSQHATISPIDNNEVVFVTRDITQQKLAEENVKASEKRYRRLFKNATDAIFVIDGMSGKINDASPQASWLLGYPLEALIGMSIEQIESDEITIQQTTTPDNQDTNQLIVETQYRHLNGDMIDVQVNSRAIQEDGKLLLISFVRDISEHKRILAEINHQKKIAEALLDTANVLNTFSDLDAVLDNILQNVSRIMPHESANIMIIEDNIAHIVRHLGYDKAGLEADAIENIVLPLDKTDNLRWVFENKKPLKIDDTHHSALFKWVNVTTSGYVQSLISAPIITNDEVVGFINVDSFQVGNFSAEQTHQLMVFANQAAIAIQRASLVQKLQDYTGKLEKRVSDRTRDLLRANKNLKNQILQRQLIEDKLEEERTLLRTLIDNIPDHIYIKDTNQQVILANKSTLRDLMTGKEFDDIFLKTNSEIFGDRNWVKRHAEQDKQLLESGEPIINQEFVYYDDTGNKHWLLVTKIPITDSQDEIMGFIGINRDITDLKNAEILLSDERNMLRLIIDTIPDAIYVKDKQGQFLLANTATVQHISEITSETELIGKTDTDLYPKISERLIQEEQHILQSGERQFNKSEIYYNDDGSVTHLLVTKLPLRDSHDKIRGIIGINHNISELRQAESQLKQVLESARCLVWSATVTQIGTKQFEWEYKIANEEAAQNFLPLQTDNTS